jgi:choline dehydrogenase-like flavoprotein
LSEPTMLISSRYCRFLATTIVYEVDSTLANPDDLKTANGLAAAYREYTQNKTGPLTVVPVSMAYVPLSHFMSKGMIERLFPPLQNTLSSTENTRMNREAIVQRRISTAAAERGHVEYVFDLGNWNPYFEPDHSAGKKYGSMLQILQYPFSTGSIHIQPKPSPASTPNHSSDKKLGTTAVPSTPQREVVINPQYYGGRHGNLDLELSMHCHRFAEKICATKPLANIIRQQVFPPLSKSSNDDDLREWLSQVMVTDWHPVGTCAMGGIVGSHAGVVDERLRVYGAKRLRVVDASVMPLQISAHLQATVYAIAEKAAHMILEDNQRSY